jgi:hypothetical protein
MIVNRKKEIKKAREFFLKRSWLYDDSRALIRYMDHF